MYRKSSVLDTLQDQSVRMQPFQNVHGLTVVEAKQSSRRSLVHAQSTHWVVGTPVQPLPAACRSTIEPRLAGHSNPNSKVEKIERDNQILQLEDEKYTRDQLG